MQSIKKYSIIVILSVSLVAGMFNHIPSYAQDSSNLDNSTMANATLAYAQNDTMGMDNSTMMNVTLAYAVHATEEEYPSEKKDYNKTNVVRDSVTILLQDKSIPGGDFIHLYDSTPYHILKGHVALKAPCDDNSTSSIQVLIGSAPNMTAVSLENLQSSTDPNMTLTARENFPTLSTPGELCLYHVDVIPEGNVTTITDIALSNPTDEDIDFPPTATVVIGINEITKGEHGHSESEKLTTEATHTE